MSTAVAVKICGIMRRPDAEAAVAAGADYLGVILASESPRSVPAATAATLLADLPVRKVGVFVNAAPDALTAAADEAGLDVLQLHGDETPEQVAELRSAGRWAVWNAVRPRSGAEFLAAIEEFGPYADALLLDGWSAAARGGTGARFPWEEIAARRGDLPSGLSLVVAGGLRPANVARAIGLLRPHAVDVSSGVESAPGIKDPEAVRAFFSAVRDTTSHTWTPED